MKILHLTGYTGKRLYIPAQSILAFGEVTTPSEAHSSFVTVTSGDDGTFYIKETVDYILSHIPYSCEP